MDINKENLQVFNESSVVKVYSSMDNLTPAEIYLFGRYAAGKSSILDLGVGAGRTTAVLRGYSKTYIGIDYAEEMVKTCRKRFPGVDFRMLDATDLSCFKDASFEVIVFSFNGLDYPHPLSQRKKCLRECARILAPGGHFIFSSHNSRAFLKFPTFANATLVKSAWRLVLAFRDSLRATALALKCPAFWSGAGYGVDGGHQNLFSYKSTPERVREDVKGPDFKLLN